MTRQVVPSTTFSTLLDAPCSALRLAQASPDFIYLVVGEATGQTLFFPTNQFGCWTKYEDEPKVPISAIAVGDLRNLGKSEVVTVTASGNLRSLSFPCNDRPGPSRLFGQQLYPNICSAEVLDIDGDGLVELVVVMTDRVVRSYRFVEELDRLVALNKWEMPTHISGWAVGLASHNFALLSQSEENHYVRLEFGPSKEVRVVQFSSDQQQVEEGGGAPVQCCPPPPPSSSTSIIPITRLIIPRRPFAVHLLHSMAQRVLLIDDDSSSDSELPLHSADVSDIACASATTLPSSSLSVVVTMDSWGQLSVYVWRAGDQQLTGAGTPLATCRVMRDADYICCCPGPRDECLFVGVVNVFNRITLFSIDIEQILGENAQIRNNK